MSPDAIAGRRRPRVGRVLLFALLGLVIAAGLFVWFAFPWGAIDGLAVERAEMIAAPRPGGRLAPGDTPMRIVVTFSVPVELGRLRTDEGAEFINATLSACEDAGSAQRVAATQTGGIFREGRVRMLPPIGSGATLRHRYQATFDDWLPVPRGSTSEYVSPMRIEGGACFSLDGGAMWLGRLSSDRVRLHPDQAMPPQ